MKAPITFALITAGEATLEAAVASVRPYAAEVVIAYTGDDYERSRSVKKLADRYLHIPEYLDPDGHMMDFASARNVSFAMATQEWISWCDSDDEVIGSENLDAVLGRAAGYRDPRILMPYDYAHDYVTGEVTSRQYRERIVRNNGHWEWRHPVHENILRTDGERPEDITDESVRWVHRRVPGANEDKGRNLRILQAQPLDPNDAWLALNLGIELARAGDPKAAIPHLRRYVDLSGWEDEKVSAMIRLSDAHVAADPQMRDDEGLWWARQALEVQPDAFGPNYQLAKLYSIFGAIRGDESALRDAIEYGRRAVAAPVKATPLAVAPRDRSYHVHDVMRSNAEWLEDWATALQSTEAILASHPKDGPALLARRRYKALLKVSAAGPTHDEAKLRGHATGPRGGQREVTVFCGETAEQWNPELADRYGIGGSERAVIEVSKRLAAKGHKMRVYCNCGTPGLYDGVEYTNDLSQVTECDVMIAWRNAAALEGIPANLKLVWAHDVGIHGATRWTLHLADRVLAVSEWHADNLVKLHGESCGLTREKIIVVGNGVDMARFDRTKLDSWQWRNPRKAIYASSPDRGLEQLLEVWPRIREQVPDAELIVFYGSAMLTKVHPDLAGEIGAKLRELSAHGVVDRGKVNPATLAREMLSAGAMLFPSWLRGGKPWTETYGISIVEAQAAGLRVVCAPHGALTETVKTGHFVPGDIGPEWLDRFTRLSVRALTEAEVPGERAGIAAAVEGMTWSAVADRVNAVLI